MLNAKPIFLNCFSRGGSNILWNLFVSHPDACSPLKETLEIFWVGVRNQRPSRDGVLAALLTRQLRFFDQWKLEPRRPISSRAERFIDGSLHAWKMRTIDDPEMKFRCEGDVYTTEELHDTRLVAKNNNGLAFLTDPILGMYPDATFFALVRDPFALYESHRRRNISSSAADFAEFYKRLTDRMLDDEARIPNYHVVRFEDMMADAVACMKQLHQAAGLELGAVPKLRFKAKAHLDARGEHGTRFEKGRHYWFDLDRTNEILEPNINVYQASRVSKEDAARIASTCVRAIERFSYGRADT